jgi:hypothetical protein
MLLGIHTDLTIHVVRDTGFIQKVPKAAWVSCTPGYRGWTALKQCSAIPFCDIYAPEVKERRKLKLSAGQKLDVLRLWWYM